MSVLRKTRRRIRLTIFLESKTVPFADSIAVAVCAMMGEFQARCVGKAIRGLFFTRLLPEIP